MLERVPVVSCVRRGAAIDLVLDRARERRSQFVFTRVRGREAIFRQTARTARQARPAVSVPRVRASGAILEILVDSREQQAWRFEGRRVTTVGQALPAGDCAVPVGGRIVGVVERKTLADLVAGLTGGKLPYQIRYPTVPIVGCETRRLAEEWAYRFLGAAAAHEHADERGRDRTSELPSAGAVPPAEPTTAEVRAWAKAHGHPVADRGRLRREIWSAFRKASGMPGPEDGPVSG